MVCAAVLTATFSFLSKLCDRVHLGLRQRLRAQVERNLHDAMGVARNVLMDPRLVPGGGAVEMAISRGLYDRSASMQGTHQVCPIYPPAN